MHDDAIRQSTIDAERLKLLSLGYMISAGISAFFSLFGPLYAFIGVVVFTAVSKMPASPHNEPPPAFVGWLFAGIGLGMFVVLLVLALLKFKAATSIRQRRSRTFGLVLAAISCLEMPYGTVLGVFTFIVLGRDSVARQFQLTLPAVPVPEREAKT